MTRAAADSTGLITIRLPRPLIRRLEKEARRQGRDRSVFLRELLEKGLAADLRQRVLKDYSEARLSAGAAAAELGIDPWEFMDLLRMEDLDRNVGIEDVLPSSRL